MARLVLDGTEKTSKIVKCIICILAVKGQNKKFSLVFPPQENAQWALGGSF